MSEERETVTITVNGEPVVAEKGELVIAAAERAGTYIPHFCYHPRMASVGMCRMCIVDIDTGRGPALQPACMIEVAPDMVVDTHSEATKKAQDGVLEFLLINHPLDCPVCDKGGECPLQDQTIAYGPGESRFVEEKRHYAKPIPVNDVVLLDRERCILCDRCTRFAKDVAGDPLISFIGRGAATQVNTFPDHPFSSYFSGNTVQICPVGALTAGPFRFRARPWDLANAESTCTTCSVGCRVAIQSSRDEVLRYSGVDVDPVNWGWLCDKGRFDFSYVNNPDRLGEPLVRTPGGSGLTTARWSEALGRAAEALEAAPADRIGVIGGARLTNESAYAWAKLAKGVLGTDNVDAQLGDGLPADLVLGLPRATIDEACAPGTTVVLLGPDIKEELGVLYLRLRHAAVEDGVRIIEIAPATSGLTPYATHTELHAPGGAPAAVASVLDAGLLGDGPVVVLLGRPSLAEPAAHTARAALALAEVGDRVRFLSTLRRGNVHGALDMGLAPGVLPGRAPLDGGREALADVWPTVPASAGLDTDAMLQRRGRRWTGRPRPPRRRSGPGRAGPGPGSPGARGGGHGDRRGLLPHRLGRGGRRRPARRRLRRGRRHHHQPRGSGQHRRPAGHQPGHGPGRLDHRHRSRRPPRVRPGRDVGRGPAGRDRAGGPDPRRPGRPPGRGGR